MNLHDGSQPRPVNGNLQEPLKIRRDHIIQDREENL
jgi:hypothetical protein